MDYNETKKNVTEIDKLFFDIENIEIKSQILTEVLWLMNDDFKIRAFRMLKNKMNRIIKKEQSEGVMYKGKKISENAEDMFTKIMGGK
jgi:hypothetical protein|tara:strand:+ start:255 stop:518 length:264 start_codon:yes stop_codon:yes gene_type:complete